MSSGEPLRQEAGSARVLHFVAASDGPKTASEIVEHFDNKQSSISNTLRSLWRSGLLVRREREGAKRGGTPYEYELAGLDVAHGPDSDLAEGSQA